MPGTHKHKKKGGVASKGKHHHSKPKGHKRVTKGTVHGKGGYFGDLAAKGGAWLGGMAGNLVDSAVSGLGDYRVKSNSLMETQGPPTVRNSKTVFAMQHREYLMDIYGSTTFNLTSFPINPGLQQTFPWLASQALSYEQYKLKGLLFEFVTTSGTSVGSTNTALGTVIMATEYNSQLPLFSSKFQMENHEYANSFVPFKDNLHPIECAPKDTTISHLYVRVGTGTAYNPLLYDMGIFQIATVGMQAGVTAIGELWVTYDIEFYKPTIPTSLSGTQPQHWYWDSSIGIAPSAAAWFQNLRCKSGGAGVTSLAQQGLLVPASGRYLMTYVCTASGTCVEAVPTPAITGGLLVNTWSTNPVTGASTVSSISAPSIGATTSNVTYNVCFDIVTPIGPAGLQSQVALTGGTLPATVLTVDIYIVSLGTGFSTVPSRKMVDYDPITLLNKKLEELTDRMASMVTRDTIQYIEQKHCEVESDGESECGIKISSSPEQTRTPVDLTRSTADLTNEVLNRLSLIGDRRLRGA